MAAALNGDFELIIPKEAETAQVELGSEITIPCRLSTGGQFSVTDITWFKETDLVCHYENRQVIEGVGYENRVRLLTEEINRGKVSISIKDFKETDFGDYLCQVTCGYRTKEITIKVEDVNKIKRERNKKVAFAVGAVGLAALPVIAGAAAIAGTAGAIYTTLAAVGAAAAATVLIYSIMFLVINRKWSEQERKTMGRSVLLAVRKCSKQARQLMEGSASLTERRNSIDLNPPLMSE